jgi:hypothetical protein
MCLLDFLACLVLWVRGQGQGQASCPAWGMGAALFLRLPWMEIVFSPLFQVSWLGYKLN